jgi:hypothetical protein
MTLSRAQLFFLWHDQMRRQTLLAAWHLWSGDIYKYIRYSAVVFYVRDTFLKTPHNSKQVLKYIILNTFFGVLIFSYFVYKLRLNIFSIALFQICIKCDGAQSSSLTKCCLIGYLSSCRQETDFLPTKGFCSLFPLL